VLKFKNKFGTLRVNWKKLMRKSVHFVGHSQVSAKLFFVHYMINWVQLEILEIMRHKNVGTFRTCEVNERLLSLKI
jgi:hypothetical protein